MNELLKKIKFESEITYTFDSKDKSWVAGIFPDYGLDTIEAKGSTKQEAADKLFELCK